MTTQDYTNSGGIFEYPEMKIQRFYLSYDPPQIGLLYRPHPQSEKKKLFLIKLNGLILLGDSTKITSTLFETYPAFLNKELVEPMQILNLIEL